MQINAIINDLDHKITATKTELVLLEERKTALIQLAEKYPDAHLEKNNTVCIDNLWEKMSCMRIAWGYGYKCTKVNIRFSIGKKDMENGIRIHSYPYNNTIATITILKNQQTGAIIYNGNRSAKEIIIIDYSKLIPDTCPKQKVFLKRIRNYLLNIVIKENMAINDQSYKKDELERLILLK